MQGKVDSNNPANTQHNKHIIITSKRRDDYVFITLCVCREAKSTWGPPLAQYNDHPYRYSVENHMKPTSTQTTNEPQWFDKKDRVPEV